MFLFCTYIISCAQVYGISFVYFFDVFIILYDIALIFIALNVQFFVNLPLLPLICHVSSCLSIFLIFFICFKKVSCKKSIFTVFHPIWLSSNISHFHRIIYFFFQCKNVYALIFFFHLNVHYLSYIFGAFFSPYFLIWCVHPTSWHAHFCIPLNKIF